MCTTAGTPCLSSVLCERIMQADPPETVFTGCASQYEKGSGRDGSSNLTHVRSTSACLTARLCCGPPRSSFLGLREWLSPLWRRRVPYTKFLLQLPQVLRPPLFPVNRDHAPRCASATQCPRHILREETCTLGGVQTNDCGGRKRCGRQSEVREFEDLQCELVLDSDWQPKERVVKVVAFAVPLHHIREFRVVDVVHLASKWAVMSGRKGGRKRVMGIFWGYARDRACRV